MLGHSNEISSRHLFAAPAWHLFWSDHWLCLLQPEDHPVFAGGFPAEISSLWSVWKCFLQALSFLLKDSLPKGVYHQFKPVQAIKPEASSKGYWFFFFDFLFFGYCFFASPAGALVLAASFWNWQPLMFFSPHRPITGPFRIIFFFKEDIIWYTEGHYPCKHAASKKQHINLYSSDYIHGNLFISWPGLRMRQEGEEE